MQISQFRLQLLQRAEQMYLHTARRTSHGAGDLRQGQALVVAHDEHGVLLGRQHAQGGVDPVAYLARPDAALRIGAGGLGSQVVGRVLVIQTQMSLPLLAAQKIDGLVGGYLEQPGLKPAGRPPLMDLSIGLDKGFLGHVEGVFTVPGHAVSDREHPTLKTTDHLVKGGVIALAKQMAVDYGPDGIRVNAICPGTVPTPLVRATYEARGGFAATDSGASAATIDEMIDATKIRNPIGRVGSVDNIAQLALHLASDESAWTTGSIITIDGGMSAA